MSPRLAIVPALSVMLVFVLAPPPLGGAHWTIWLALLLMTLPAFSRTPPPSPAETPEEQPTPRSVASAPTMRSQIASDRELAIKLETYTLIDRLLGSLPTQPTLASIAEGVIDFVRQKVECQSTVLFWMKEGALVPVAMATPHPPPTPAQLSGGPVEAALRSGRMVLTQENPRLTLLFPDEPTALVVPLGDRGVLYVGQREHTPYRSEPVNLVNTLARHTLPTLRAAHFHQGQREALQSEARARAQLQNLVQQLATMLDGIAELVSVKNPEWLLGRTGQLLERLIPHRVREISAGGISSGKGIEDPVAAHELRQLVTLSRTTMLEDAVATGLRAPAPGCDSLLVVPLMIQDTPIGSVMLARARNEPFTQQELDVLSVLSYQLGSAFESARLFTALEEAHGALKTSQAQLIQSSKMAAIGQLAGGVAHELNTPLGAISLGATAALDMFHTKPERAEKRLTNIVAAAAQMKEIVAKLLFYSREARSGRADTDVNKVINDTLEMIGSQLKLDNVKIETELGQVPIIEANQSELQQIFTNLLINARDAVLGAGNVTEKRICITSSVVDGRLQVTVRDWGPGVPEELRSRIFEPFFTTKPIGQGTGLGLSVTMELVEQHQGTLGVRPPTDGVGAEFVVTLPV